jgi:hypothetical protein
MQRWEYKVVSFPGRYTEALNEHGREGWELVDVVTETHVTPRAKGGRSIPMPRAISRIEDAASKIGSMAGEEQKPEPGSAVSSLLWVLRRPLED